MICNITLLLLLILDNSCSSWTAKEIGGVSLNKKRKLIGKSIKFIVSLSFHLIRIIFMTTLIFVLFFKELEVGFKGEYHLLL